MEEKSGFVVSLQICEAHRAPMQTLQAVKAAGAPRGSTNWRMNEGLAVPRLECGSDAWS